MSFVRPKVPSTQDSRPDWYAMIGAADEHNGDSLEQLARALRLIATSWPLLMIARAVLLGQAVGWWNIQAALVRPGFLIFLGAILVIDLGIMLAPRLPVFARLSPNQQLLVTAPFVALSSAVFATSAAAALGSDFFRLMVVTLTPALLAVAIFGRQRLLSIAYGLGGVIAFIGNIPVMDLLTPMLVFATGVTIVMAVEFRISRRATAQLRENMLTGDQAKAFLVDLEQSGRGWFWETDRAGNITYISETLAARLGRGQRQLLGRPFASLIAPPEPGTPNEGQRSLSFHLSTRTSFCDLAVRVAGTQDELWWSVSGQPAVTPFGQFLGFRGSGTDLTEMRRSQAEITRLAKFDSLTGLANRSHMLATLEQALTEQRGIMSECALLLLDLDRFKEVNDTMGHPAGDALLRQVAQRLLRLVGTDGKVGRLGGDEFEILLPGLSDRTRLTRLAKAIIETLSQPYSIEGSQVVIGASIGIAIAPTDGKNAETLTRNADLALYAAKDDGRGAFRYFAPAMHADAEDRRQLEQDLRLAIAARTLRIDYQPVVCASSEKITGFEALIRWDHPERGTISPTAFIPIAEEAGLIGAIGEWVIRTACTDAAGWPEGTRVAVNVSPIQFANPGFPSLIMSALAMAGLSANRLELEITESVFLADGADTDGMFTAIKNLGVRLALDDFGTGYSALGYLKHAPFDKIKIDQSFVRGAAIKGSRNAAIVKSIVNLAEALGMETTAEGAETMDELALIRSLGCSHVQGFVYGAPVDAAGVRAMLAAGKGHAEASGHKASREPRMAMLRSVTLMHDGHSYPARIRNISSRGAMVEGLVDVPIGTVFEIELIKGYNAQGTCRWSEGERMGIEFATAIDVERLRAPPEKEKVVTDIPDFYREGWRQTG
ncbi:EAL domain-containing protein [Sphingobium lignivorans]|uniref:Diguanylate cyclase (GGDEF)-like protein n=1 Tax=Sphingobium lignivorans TaxID=2735886 RepID=A0ABR6NJQ4_9SPHN|nr:EAL domain-containing protein [Sphingobium lignivorans]MBB5987336.1 diguanylate cyclase (GGDEF)-like protein [Sphingobium lignivorans]